MCKKYKCERFYLLSSVSLMDLLLLIDLLFLTMNRIFVHLAYHNYMDSRHFDCSIFLFF